MERPLDAFAGFTATGTSLEELTRDDGMHYRNRAFDYYKTPRYW